MTTEGKLPTMDAVIDKFTPKPSEETEQAETGPEQAEGDEKQANAEVSEEPKAEVPETEEKAEVPEGAESESEDIDELVQEAVNKEYAKWQSKQMTPITKERDALKKQVTELTNKETLETLRLKDQEEIGEVDAERYDKARQAFIEKVNEYETNSADVQENKEKIDSIREIEKDLGVDNLAEHIPWLGSMHKTVTTKDDLLKVYDPAVYARYQQDLKKLDSSKTQEGYQQVLKNITTEVKSGRKKQTFDSSRQEGGDTSGEKHTQDSLKSYSVKGKKTEDIIKEGEDMLNKFFAK